MKSYAPLIYNPEKSLEVLRSTNSYFDANSELKEKYENLGWAYFSIGKSIPQTMENLWSGHFFPYRESWDELQISFNLVLLGLYKQAFVSLRGALELGLLSVYYNINDEGHKTVKDWLKSKNTWEANTPRSDKIWKILNSNNNISKFNNKYDLSKDFDNLSFLHNYVHTKGYKYSNSMGILKSNFQTFEASVLIEWLDTYEKIIKIVITLHMLKYPISIIEYDWGRKIGIDNPYPVLEIFEIQRIKDLLPKEHITEIKSIAESDSETKNLFNHINEMPDMSEEEAEVQIINLDKSIIEHGLGFLEWEKQELRLIEKYNQESKNKVLKRINLLREWAIENDMIKSKLVRLKEHSLLRSNENT